MLYRPPFFASSLLLTAFDVCLYTTTAASETRLDILSDNIKYLAPGR